MHLPAPALALASAFSALSSAPSPHPALTSVANPPAERFLLPGDIAINCEGCPCPVTRSAIPGPRTKYRLGTAQTTLRISDHSQKPENQKTFCNRTATASHLLRSLSSPPTDSDAPPAAKGQHDIPAGQERPQCRRPTLPRRPPTWAIQTRVSVSGIQPVTLLPEDYCILVGLALTRHSRRRLYRHETVRPPPRAPGKLHLNLILTLCLTRPPLPNSPRDSSKTSTER